MKKIIIYTCMAIFAINIAGCKKYAEGPSFSILSKNSRIANVWTLDQYFENGVDKTNDAKNLFKDFKLIIDKNNMKYSKSFTALGLLPYGESGGWKFSTDKNSVEFTPDNTTIAAYSYKIIKLKDKEVAFSYTSNGVEYKLYLKE